MFPLKNFTRKMVKITTTPLRGDELNQGFSLNKSYLDCFSRALIRTVFTLAHHWLPGYKVKVMTKVKLI